MDKFFTYSLNNEEWDGSVYSSREEALVYARSEYQDQVWEDDRRSDHVVFTCELQLVRVSSLLPSTKTISERVLELIQDQIDDRCAASEVPWIEGISQNDRTTLGNMLTSTVLEWMTNTKHIPTFYDVLAVESHPAIAP